ncbi:hypothetical protein ACE2AJ_18250 [Aquihabitans daechungensis]
MVWRDRRAEATELHPLVQLRGRAHLDGGRAVRSAGSPEAEWSG